VVNHVEVFFLTSRLITMQNLVAFSHTECEQVPKVLGTLGTPPPWDMVVAEPQKLAHIHVLLYNFVIHGQTVWALDGVPQIWGSWDPAP